MSIVNLALCVVFSVSLACGQMLFKWAALSAPGIDGGPVAKTVLNGPLWAAFAWYGLTALLWFYILTRVPLSSAYLFSLAGSALVVLAAWLVFREPISTRFWLGYALMLGGLYLALTGR